MAAPILFSGPEDTDGRLFCAVCAAIAKGHVVQQEQEKINRANAGTPDDPVVLISVRPGQLPARMRIEPAVTTGLVNLPAGMMGQMAVVPAPVCWSHVNGMIIKDGILPATAGEMPHERGAVVLGGRPFPK
jgi:hypothetical protein